MGNSVEVCVRTISRLTYSYIDSITKGGGGVITKMVHGFLPLFVHDWTSAFFFNDHRMRVAVEGDWEQLKMLLLWMNLLLPTLTAVLGEVPLKSYLSWIF